MRLIDADKFLEYLIFSKHIDSLKCDEVKKAVEICEVKMPTVCDIDAIREEIEQIADEEQKHDEKWAIGLRYSLKIIDKYTGKESQ